MHDGQRLVAAEDREGWNEALAPLPHAFGHTWESCRAISMSTSWEIALYVWEREHARVACPVALRPFGDSVDVVTPHGFAGFIGIGDPTGFMQDWRSFAAARGWTCGFIQINPLLPELADVSHDRDRRIYKDVFALDLSRAEDELFSGLSSSRRSAIRKFERAAGSWVDDHDRVGDFGRRQLAGFLASRGGSTTFPAFTDQAWNTIIGSPYAIAFGAEVDGRLVAINVVVATDHVADEFLLICEPGYEWLSMPLKWEGLLRLKRSGVALVNLGGGVRPGDGVEAFKRTLGAQRQPLAGLRQIYDPDGFERICAQQGVEPDDQAYFPPYRDPARLAVTTC